MYKIDLSGGCFECPSSEDNIIIWFASKKEHTRLEDFITDCWTKEYNESNFGGQTLEEWFAEFKIEDVPPERFQKVLQEYNQSLKWAELKFDAQYIRAVRLIEDRWNEVIYAAESENDYICYWWYTTA